MKIRDHARGKTCGAILQQILVLGVCIEWSRKNLASDQLRQRERVLNNVKSSVNGPTWYDPRVEIGSKDTRKREKYRGRKIKIRHVLTKDETWKLRRIRPEHRAKSVRSPDGVKIWSIME